MYVLPLNVLQYVWKMKPKNLKEAQGCSICHVPEAVLLKTAASILEVLMVAKGLAGAVRDWSRWELQLLHQLQSRSC